ncbi:hypothetical protein [Cupriavidus sp. PET2-C1]
MPAFEQGQTWQWRSRWKVVFLEQRAHGLEVWSEPPVQPSAPLLFDLWADPFERAQIDGWGYAQWKSERAYVLVPAQAFIGQWLETLKEFPPRQKPGSFTIGDAMVKLTTNTTGR